MKYLRCFALIVVNTTRWLLAATLNFAFTLIAYPAALLLPAFATSTGYLPTWLWWFQTPDNSLDGDTAFQASHAWFTPPQTGWRRYVNRIWWLMRNPAYGFGIDVAGVSVTATPKLFGTLPLGGALTQSGWYFAWTSNAWQFYGVWIYSSTRCARLNLGWKLWQVPGVCQLVLSPLPFVSLPAIPA